MMNTYQLEEAADDVTAVAIRWLQPASVTGSEGHTSYLLWEATTSLINTTVRVGKLEDPTMPGIMFLKDSGNDVMQPVGLSRKLRRKYKAALIGNQVHLSIADAEMADAAMFFASFQEKGLKWLTEYVQLRMTDKVVTEKGGYVTLSLSDDRLRSLSQCIVLLC